MSAVPAATPVIWRVMPVFSFPTETEPEVPFQVATNLFCSCCFLFRSDSALSAFFSVSVNLASISGFALS